MPDPIQEFLSNYPGEVCHNRILVRSATRRPASPARRQRQTRTPRQDQDIRGREESSPQRIGQGGVDPRGRSSAKGEEEPQAGSSISAQNTIVVSNSDPKLLRR